MISIIIPVYNQSKKLDKCLASIARETYDNYEIIVVNDRSTDRLSWVYKKYSRLFGYKIEWINNQTNHGAPYARNKGFLASRGEFVIFCDADVVMGPEMLADMLGALKKNEKAAYAYSSFKFGRKTFRLWPFDADKLKTMPYIHSTSLIRRECFSGWDETLERLQDWDLWLSMLEKGYAGVWIDKNLFTIIDTGGTMSSWLPSLAYKLFPFLSKVKKYEQAVKIIKNKHGLTG
jgi:glycosyltransferase EpsE